MPIYRLYHPGIKRHLYTKDAGEYQILGQRGWQQEGVAFYGLGWPANQIPPQAGNLAGKLTIQQVNQQKGSFEILISGISSPKGVQSILVPVWSAEKGQDDVVWYQASPLSNGVFRVQVEARNHHYSQGIYHIHLYYKTLENQMVFVTSGQHQVEIRQTTVEGKVTIQEVSHQRGNFTVKVTDLFPQLVSSRSCFLSGRRSMARMISGGIQPIARPMGITRLLFLSRITVFNLACIKSMPMSNCQLVGMLASAANLSA